jgi:hypothetical protein
VVKNSVDHGRINDQLEQTENKYVQFIIVRTRY